MAVLVMLGVVMGGCTHTGNPKPSPPAPRDEIPLSVLTTSEAVPVADLRLEEQVERQECLEIVRVSMRPILDLWSLLDRSEKELASKDWGDLNALRPASVCATVEGRRRLSNLNERLLARVGRGVAVLVPESLRSDPRTRAILTGMARGASRGRGERDFITQWLPANPKDRDRAMARLYFLHPMLLWIGGWNEGDVAEVSKWAHALSQPLFVLRSGAVSSPYVFDVGPNIDSLAATLAQGLAGAGVEGTAILLPRESGARSFADALAHELSILNTRVLRSDYESDNFEAVDRSVRGLLGIQGDQSLRDMRSSLAFQSVVVLDDFRTLRHISKLFRFYGAPRLLWAGNYEWRAPGLVDPPEAVLEGAFFVDWVGRYTDLPPRMGLKEQTLSLLPTPAIMRTLDHTMLGYHATRIAEEALARVRRGGSSVTRFLRVLARMMPPADTVLDPRATAFDYKQRLRWPSHILEVRDKGRTIALREKNWIARVTFQRRDR